MANKARVLQKKKTKKKENGLLVTFWFDTFVKLFMPLGMLLVMKALEVERFVDIKAYISLPVLKC